MAGALAAATPNRLHRFDSSLRMDVYLVPAGLAGHALYCEVASAPVVDGDDDATSWLERMKARFRRAVDEGEAAQNNEADDRDRGRLRRFITRKLAETVAEQRLLWHLRNESDARLFHSDAIEGAEAQRMAMADFNADYGRHRRWLLVNGLLVAITGPLLFFIPGPNLVSWYFTFRAIGHYFSMRGARKALSSVTWTTQATVHLTSVADALRLDTDARCRQLAAAGDALGLSRLASFVERVAVRSA